MIEPTPIAIRELLQRYDGVLLDVYGVLFDARGPLPGAAELIRELDRQRKPFAIVTNDASRSPATYAARFASHGISVAADRFVTAGSLVSDYLVDNELDGGRFCVLGTPDSFDYVRQGYVEPVAPAAGIAIDGLVVCDDDGFEFLPGIEHAFSAVVRMVEAGRVPALVLPNPDLVYPKGDGELGFTAGSIALLLEAVLARRFPREELVFARLGKPQRYLFDDAAHRLALPHDRLVMIGDQLETDIAGAEAAGIAAALLSGVSSWDHARGATKVMPTWLLSGLS